MNTIDRKHLEKAGFTVETDAAEFLGLDAAERELVALRLAAARAVRAARAARNMTQEELAKAIKSSQSRIAKIEATAADVSLDLSFRALFAAGGSFGDVKPVTVEKAKPKAAVKVSRRQSKA